MILLSQDTRGVRHETTVNNYFIILILSGNEFIVWSRKCKKNGNVHPILT